MSSRAYTREIKANGADGVHSVSPSWVLTFIRWNNRYLGSADPGISSENDAYFLSTRDPLVVESDCASVSVSYSKESHTPTMSATLYPGNINYLTAVAPGDFVFVNMLENEAEAGRVANLAVKGLAINGATDGFKGFFKVQSVRRSLSIDPATGTKKIMFQITGFAFTEFNNTIYFNPHLISQQEASNQFLYITRLSSVWEQYIGNNKGTTNVQDLITLLIDSTIGTGFNSKATQKKQTDITQNTHFYIPASVGRLLGEQNAKAAKDVYNYLFGIQQYNFFSSADPETSPNLPTGMNPKIANVRGRYYTTPMACQGGGHLKPEYWNQVPVWSILNQYVNSPVNELFTTLRIAPDGRVMPTLVFRQTPFSSEKYKGKKSTKFLNLPRWKVSPDLLLDINIGRDEAARINFVQAFATVPQANAKSNGSYISMQIAQQNYDTDILDIRRSGLKPYIFSSNFDTFVIKDQFLGPVWARLIGDAVIGGHLKLNGSISVFGIVDPIAVGDNLELDGVVYHIEGLSHSCSLQPNGQKRFTTHLEISHGVDIRSADGPKIFAEMDAVSMQDAIDTDRIFFDSNLPSVSADQAPSSKSLDQNKEEKDLAPFPSVPGSPPKKNTKNKTDRKPGKRK